VPDNNKVLLKISRELKEFKMLFQDSLYFSFLFRHLFGLDEILSDELSPDPGTR